MENLTHSLVGATLAELALPAEATREQRRIFFVAGVLAANLPDADLLYSRITPPPLGYLLHHRGHTHTVAGIAMSGVLVGALCLLPAIARHIVQVHARLAALIVLALVSHLVLDSWNEYGVHPFWPFDARWIYGDAIQIFEPWLWVPLGVTAMLNTRHRMGRGVLGAALVILPLALAHFGMVPRTALAALAVAGVGLVLAVRGWPAKRRAAVGVALAAAFVVGMFVVRDRVRAEALASMDPVERAKVVDMVVNPEAANPLCWTLLSITRDEPRGEYVTARGTAAPFTLSGCGARHKRAVAWDAQSHHSLHELREQATRSCAVRAWLQFGRVPEIAGGTIGDLRYGGMRTNFSSMPLGDPGDAARCPPHLTAWGTPRADLMGATPQ